MKPLTLEETRLKEQMKERCLAKGQYIDENAKAKFDMLCHLENFEVQYWELQQQNQKLKQVIDKLSSQIKLYGKYNGEKCTRGFSMMTADFNKLLDILKEVE